MYVMTSVRCYFANLPPQPEPIKNLNELIKSQVSAPRPSLLASWIIILSLQLRYYAFAAEALSAVQGEIEELSVAAEGDYRYCRSFFRRLLFAEHTSVGSLATTEISLNLED